MNYKLLLQLEQEENLKLKKIMKELKSDIEIYKIRLKKSKNLSSKAPDKDKSNTSIAIKQLNIYC